MNDNYNGRPEPTDVACPGQPEPMILVRIGHPEPMDLVRAGHPKLMDVYSLPCAPWVTQPMDRLNAFVSTQATASCAAIQSEKRLCTGARPAKRSSAPHVKNVANTRLKYKPKYKA